MKRLMAHMAQHIRPRSWLWSVLAAVWLLLALPVAAQTGSVSILDPDNLLGTQRGAVEQAAQQLANEGAQVIVVTDAQNGVINAPNDQAYVTSLLQQNGVALTNGRISPTQIVYYINPTQGFSGLYYGASWRRVLDPVYQSITREQITPRARTGDLAGAFVAGINAARTTINPPTPPLFYILGGVLALTVVGLVAAPVLRRRRETATALSTAREQATQARRAAGAAIADLGQRMETAQAKAQYDQLSYPPADAQRVQALQQEADQAFGKAQAAFDAADEQEQINTNMTSAEYERVASQYAQARQLAKQAEAALNKAEQLRATLDAQGTTNTAPPSL
jgi:exonuclease VII small subunit